MNSLPSVFPTLPTRREICTQRLIWQANGEKVAFTSGVFDLIHIGHVKFLDAIKPHTNASKLIVGVNSDTSVQGLKGALRPIVTATQRAQILLALKSVDAVFIFNEANNKENILELKPDFYVKASDYTEATLSSAKYLKAWGGAVHTLQMEAGHSTSKLIEKILITSLAKGLLPQSFEHYPLYDLAGKPRAPRPAIFLDRDGVLIVDTDYLHRPEAVRLLPSVDVGLKKLMQLGYVLIVVTNQPGIGMGYFSREEFFRVNKEMLRLLFTAGVELSGVYFCPHSQAVTCTCRKPEGGMIRRAVEEHLLDLKTSFLIGDQTSDLETAKRLKLPAILVSTGKAGNDGKYKVVPDFKADDFLAAVHWIEQQAH